MSNSNYVESFLHKKPFGWNYMELEKSSNGSLTHFWFEEINPFFWHNFVESRRSWAIYASVIYIFTIFGIQRIMRDRPALKLNGSLFWWNLSLGIFSVIGFTRILPSFVGTLQRENGFYESICTKTGMDIQSAFWILVFIFSKFWELGDTVFIVLRKRPLIFLQWYHHVITMTVTWILAPMVEPISRWYAILNYGVHSLMYPYFAARARGWHVPSPVANLITTLQLVQMIIGLGVNMLSLYYQKTGHDCVRYPLSIQLFGLVYGSFVVLFGNLFYESVVKKGRIAKDSKLAKKID